MELISILFVILLAVIFLKILAVILHTGVFLLTLPFKILGILLSVIIVFAVLLPIGVVGAVAGILVAPLAILVVLLPFILVGLGLYLILNR